MMRNALMGAVTFGLAGAAAAYVWTSFEFPFAIVVPAFVGWYMVIRREHDARRALVGGAVGGVTFTGVFLAALFLAITDGSPVALTAGMAAILAAAVAGALTGWVLGGVRHALVVSGFSAAGMSVAAMAAGLLRSFAPGSVDVEGVAQAVYFAATMGVVATIVGAAAGAAVSWAKEHAGVDGHEGTRARVGRPHAG